MLLNAWLSNYVNGYDPDMIGSGTDYLFINGDFIASKVLDNVQTNKLLNIVLKWQWGSLVFVLRLAYQGIFYVGYVAVAFAMWFVYALFYRIEDSHRDLRNRYIIAKLNPDNTDRIIICAHWDSRPWADNDEDEKNHRTPVLAANDGASGVAMMMEICRLLQETPIKVGIDFICFDAEDMGTPQWAETEESTSDTWCLGSKFWAERAQEEGYRARYGVLLDMVGGRGSVFPAEKVSQDYAQPIASLVVRLGNQLGYGHYFPLNRDGGYLMDDHVNVNRIARIPCIDIVPNFTDGPSSFGPTWHTVNDTPENIDVNVLEAVGQTLTQLIYNEEL